MILLPTIRLIFATQSRFNDIISSYAINTEGYSNDFGKKSVRLNKRTIEEATDDKNKQDEFIKFKEVVGSSTNKNETNISSSAYDLPLKSISSETKRDVKSFKIEDILADEMANLKELQFTITSVSPNEKWVDMMHKNIENSENKKSETFQIEQIHNLPVDLTTNGEYHKSAFHELDEFRPLDFTSIETQKINEKRKIEKNMDYLSYQETIAFNMNRNYPPAAIKRKFVGSKDSQQYDQQSSSRSLEVVSDSCQYNNPDLDCNYRPPYKAMSISTWNGLENQKIMSSFIKTPTLSEYNKNDSTNNSPMNSNGIKNLMLCSSFNEILEKLKLFFNTEASNGILNGEKLAILDKEKREISADDICLDNRPSTSRETLKSNGTISANIELNSANMPCKHSDELKNL